MSKVHLPRYGLAVVVISVFAIVPIFVAKQMQWIGPLPSTPLKGTARLTQLYGVSFPKQATIVESGEINTIGKSFPEYAYVWAIVVFPKKYETGFINQKTLKFYDAKATMKWKAWLTDAPRRDRFATSHWNVAQIKNYKVGHDSGFAGGFLVDKDNPNSTTVYIDANT